MEKRSKYKREEKTITKRYVARLRERLTKRDKQILKFLSNWRLVTSKQIAKKFFHGTYKRKSANRRLRKLFDWYCIKRFFPVVDSGSSLQHITLDKAGKRALRVKKYSIMDRLPLTYNHYILATETAIMASKYGIKCKREVNLDTVRCDLYNAKYNIAIEADTGTETYKTLDDKLERYNRLYDINVVFLTDGNINRAKYFLKNSRNTTAAGSFKHLEKIFKKIKNNWI